MLLKSQTIIDKIEPKLRREVKKFPPQSIKLVVVLVGKNKASLSFVKQKARLAKRLGVSFVLVKFDEQISQAELAKKMRKLSRDKKITGLVIQLPLPKQIKVDEILKIIPPEKDVDCLGQTRNGLMAPAAKAVVELLKNYQIEIKNQKFVIIGQGRLIGQPLAPLAKKLGASVRTADIKTPNLKTITRQADILVSATGQPCLVKENMIKRGVVIVDAGFNLQLRPDGSSQIVGDVDFSSVKSKAGALSPSIGGLGPLTVLILMDNLIKLKKSNVIH